MGPEFLVINMSDLAKHAELRDTVMKSLIDSMDVTIGQLIESREKLGVINYGSVVSLYMNALGLLEACGIDKAKIDMAVLPSPLMK